MIDGKRINQISKKTWYKWSFYINIVLFFIIPTGFSNNYNIVSGPPGGLLSPIPSFTGSFYDFYKTLDILFFGLFLLWGAWIVSLGTEKMFRTSKTLSVAISLIVPIILILNMVVNNFT